METDSTTVATIWTAWQMTTKLADLMIRSNDSSEIKAKKIRDLYIENYKAIIQAMQSSSQETDADSA